MSFISIVSAKKAWMCEVNFLGKEPFPTDNWAIFKPKAVSVSICVVTFVFQRETRLNTSLCFSPAEVFLSIS